MERLNRRMLGLLNLVEEVRDQVDDLTNDLISVGAFYPEVDIPHLQLLLGKFERYCSSLQYESDCLRGHFEVYLKEKLGKIALGETLVKK